MMEYEKHLMLFFYHHNVFSPNVSLLSLSYQSRISWILAFDSLTKWLDFSVVNYNDEDDKAKWGRKLFWFFQSPFPCSPFPRFPLQVSSPPPFTIRLFEPFFKAVESRNSRDFISLFFSHHGQNYWVKIAQIVRIQHRWRIKNNT